MTGNDDGGKTTRELNITVVLAVVAIVFMFALPFVL